MSSYRKISELTPHNLDLNEVVELASIDHSHTIRRVNISENVMDTEQQAIDRVIEIYRTGKKAFILPYKE